MKQSRLLLIICAIALLASSCHKEKAPHQEVSATFTIDMPLTKALADGLQATDLFVRVFDASHNFLFEQKSTKKDGGWKVELKLVPGTYSFSFWAQSPKADAFTFDGEYMSLTYAMMDMNSDSEDAFWASVADKEITSPFTQSVTLKRPFTLIQWVSNKFINVPLDGATSSMTVSGMMCTRMNLITGKRDEAARKAIFSPAPITDYTVGRMTIAAYAYVLVPEEGVEAATVDYTLTLGDGSAIEGSASNVPLEPNHRTTLRDY